MQISMGHELFKNPQIEARHSPTLGQNALVML